MSRRSYDPWKKKQAKGMKIFGSALKTTMKVGAITAKELSKNQTTNKNYQPTNIPQNNQNQMPKGCGTGLIVFGLVAIILAFFGDKINFFVIILIAGVIAFIASLIASSSANKPALNFSNQNDVSLEEKSKIDEITQLIIADNHFDDIKNIVENNQVDLKVLQKSFDNAVDHFLNDNLLSQEEENRIVSFKDYFNLSQQDLNLNGSYEKTVQSSILREITSGNIPENAFRIDSGFIPFSLNKNEKLIWVFQNVDYHEEAIKRSYEGRSSGVSIRVAKGLYYRTGAFKGHPVETQYLKYVGQGLLGFTDKNIYFYSHSKSFKIPYSKIVSTMPYDDGIRIQKDGVTAKPQIFSNLSGWFSYNLIMNLSQI